MRRSARSTGSVRILKRDLDITAGFRYYSGIWKYYSRTACGRLIILRTNCAFCSKRTLGEAGGAVGGWGGGGGGGGVGLSLRIIQTDILRIYLFISRC